MEQKKSVESMEGMIRCSANHVPLSPISFLERSASVYRDRVAIVYGRVKFTWRDTLERCTRLASAITHLGISRGDVVAALAPNIPAMYELHFGVPMAGAVLCTLNIRHDSAMVSTLLKHSEAKMIFVDYQLLDTAQEALEILSKTRTKLPRLVLIPECDKLQPTISNSGPTVAGDLEYETLIAMGKTDFDIRWPNDEWDPIALNYTSGTTSRPKGVIYSHRGAHLNSLAAVLLNEMGSMPVYLWTVPMFHCNGWCLTWGVAAQGGIFDSISQHRVTHMGGAPTVLNMIINAPVGDQRPLPGKVAVMTGGAPPPPQVLFNMKELGFGVFHSYGLTETYGPGTVCTWKPEWDLLPPDKQAKINARQGLHHLGMEEVDIKDPVTMKSVPPDAKTIGEVMFRGNTVMNGYLKDIKATEESFKGGWFRSLMTTGETPCAFVKLKEGCNANANEIIKFCRNKLPHYMAPKTVVFYDLPKTSTGKTQKYILKEKAKAMGSLSKRSSSKM
ncbi:hypothetical protein AAG906_029962 [Vitis piasezkii]